MSPLRSVLLLALLFPLGCGDVSPEEVAALDAASDESAPATSATDSPSLVDPGASPSELIVTAEDPADDAVACNCPDGPYYIRLSALGGETVSFTLPPPDGAVEAPSLCGPFTAPSAHRGGSCSSMNAAACSDAGCIRVESHQVSWLTTSGETLMTAEVTSNTRPSVNYERELFHVFELTDPRDGSALSGELRACLVGWDGCLR